MKNSLKHKLSQLLASTAHLYTMLGGVIGVYSIVLIIQGDFIEAWMANHIAMIIDYTDGMYARKLKVKKYLPGFDGGSLDNVIDTLNYSWVPIILIYQAVDMNFIFLIPAVVATLYAYAQADMKTDDNYFLGFPTYWNTVTFYLYFMGAGVQTILVVYLTCMILTFIPLKYYYPSRDLKTNLPFYGCAVWMLVLTYYLFVDQQDSILYVSLLYPLYYFTFSLWENYDMLMKFKDKSIQKLKSNDR